MANIGDYHLIPASEWVLYPENIKKEMRSLGCFPVNDAFLPLWERPYTTKREILILYGTYGSSKTHDRILEHLLLSMTEKYFKCFYGRAKFDDAKGEFHSSIVSAIKREGLEDLFEYSEKPNGTKQIVCKTTGNKFIPFGCDDEDSIGKGWDDATHVLLDEMNQILFKQFGMLQSRTRKKGVRKAFTGMFNNCDVKPDHWIVTDLLNKNVDLVDNKGKKIERNLIEHFSKYTDNYFIDHEEYKQQLIEQAGKNNPERQAAVLNGLWGVSGTKSPFYKDFSATRHTKYVPYNPQLALHFTFDENVNPYLPCSIWQFDGLKAYCIDEIAAQNPYNKLRWVCSELVKRYGENGHNHQGAVYVYGDATSRKDDTKTERGKDFFMLAKEYLACFKPRVRVQKSNPNVQTRGNFINDILGLNIYQLSITISTICKHMIADFTHTAESPDGNGKDKHTETVDGIRGVQKWGHFSDGADYVICEVWASQYNKFRNGGRKAKYVIQPRQAHNYF